MEVARSDLQAVTKFRDSHIAATGGRRPVLLAGVDYLDRFKGVQLKLLAWEGLLTNYPKYRRGHVLVQVHLPPSPPSYTFSRLLTPLSSYRFASRPEIRSSWCRTRIRCAHEARSRAGALAFSHLLTPSHPFPHLLTPSHPFPPLPTPSHRSRRRSRRSSVASPTRTLAPSSTSCALASPPPPACSSGRCAISLHLGLPPPSLTAARMLPWQESDVSLFSAVREAVNVWPLEYVLTRSFANIPAGVVVLSEFRCTHLHASPRISMYLHRSPQISTDLHRSQPIRPFALAFSSHLPSPSHTCVPVLPPLSAASRECSTAHSASTPSRRSSCRRRWTRPSSCRR